MLDKLQADLKDAMISRDTLRVDTLKSLKTALMNEKIKLGHELSEEEEIATVQREAKKRKEAIDLYQRADRATQAEAEAKELEIIDSYLPQQLSEAELVEKAQGAIAELGITGPQDMGRVMGHLSSQLKGRADNATLAQIVRELLGGQRK